MAIKAVIFDWAGTVVDYGCCAPAGTFVETFRRHGVIATLEQARGPMGTHKRMHIELMLKMPGIAEQWVKAHGKPATSTDIDQLYHDFIPLQLEILPQPRFANVIPGAVEIAEKVRSMGAKLGSCTGYSREMMDIVVPLAARQGYSPDCVVCATEVPTGRPSPLMAYKNMIELDAWPAHLVVKVGDTVADMDEGRHAGIWTVGVTVSGNEVGLSYDEIQTADVKEIARRREIAIKKLEGARAHYVIDSVADLPPVLEAIEFRVKAGERPW